MKTLTMRWLFLTLHPPSAESLALLQQEVNPNSDSLSFGQDIYLCALQFVMSE